MKADSIPELGAAPSHGSGREFEHRPRAEVKAGRPPRREPLVKSDDHPVGIKEEGVDGAAHSEGVDGAAGLYPKSLSLAQRRREEESAQPGAKASGVADPLSDPSPGCFVFCAKHESILAK